jgi:hypothetical protein
MYVDDILLSSSDVNLLLQTMKLLPSKLTSLYISVKHHSFKELKFTEIQVKGYYDYRKVHT